MLDKITPYLGKVLFLSRSEFSYSSPVVMNTYIYQSFTLDYHAKRPHIVQHNVCVALCAHSLDITVY